MFEIVFVNCLVKQFAICLEVFDECDGVVECGWGAPLDIPCMFFHRMYVLVPVSVQILLIYVLFVFLYV